MARPGSCAWWLDIISMKSNQSMDPLSSLKGR
jgi:hypothetical protein